MKRKGKKKVVNKEDIAESWCFVCKDGGYLRICDDKKCLKSYHPSCVGKDDSLLESTNKWTCDWHCCSTCGRSSYFQCYTCTTAFCRCCPSGAHFLQVKEKYGFCNECLKLAMLIEENKNCDSDGDVVDFTDRDSCEGLYMEYYVIIKEQEGFEKEDIYASQGQAKMTKNLKSDSGSEYDEDDEQISADDDLDYVKEFEGPSKKTKSGKQLSLSQRHMKSNKEDFIGWGSRSLLEFLSSIGKSTNEKLSQHDVFVIVNDYIKENKLFHPNKKKLIVCDERLQSLFKKRTINKYRLHDSLEAHFTENQDNSEEDEQESDSENISTVTLDAYKKHKKVDVKKREVEHGASSDVFAAIVVENMKLVYLKRTLLLEMLKNPESFEEMVTGSYVRVKSDPYDYCSRNSHQLMLVKGVKRDSVCENNGETILQVSELLKEIRICQLSDDDFSKEECEELRQKTVTSSIKRYTVAELEQKAKILHKDITMHWIQKELVLLQKLIDRANEKGWRRELFEYLEKKKKLQTPSEQEQLLENVGKVIPEIPEVIIDTEEDKRDVMHRDEVSPKSILLTNSAAPVAGWQGNKISGENICHGLPCIQEAEKSASTVLECYRSRKHGNSPVLKSETRESGKQV